MIKGWILVGMEIRKIEKVYHGQLKSLMKTVVDLLPKKEWLITPTQEEVENIFENSKVDYWGAFDGDKLVAISSLSYDEDDFAEIVKLLGIEKNKVAEIAECMTLPEARGNNLMFKINSLLVEKARERGIEYLIATAHPENNASNISLQKLGMTIAGQFYRYGKNFRNYLVIRINDINF